MSFDPGRLDRLFDDGHAAPSGTREDAPPRTGERVALVGLGRALLWVACFFTGYHILRPTAQNVTLSDVALIAAFLLLITQGRVTLKPFGLMTPLWLGALSLMLGGLFLSTLFDGDLLRWAVIAIQYLLGFLFAPMLLMAQERPFVSRLAVAFVVGVATMEAIGIAVSLVMTPADAAEIFGKDFLAGNGRLGTFVGEANWNGAMIAFSLPMLLHAVQHRLISMPFGAVLALVLAWGLVQCASFTGLAATSVALAISTLFAGRRQIVAFAVTALVGVGIFFAAGAPVPAVFETRVGGAIAAGDLEQAGTFAGRAELIREAWYMAEDTSLIGVGADEFRNHSTTNQPVHNMYMLFWTEGGIIALAGLMSMLSLLGVLAATPTGDRTDNGMALAVVAVFLIYTIASPHMFSRLWILPVMLALGRLYARAPAYPFVPPPLPARIRPVRRNRISEGVPSR